MAYKAKVTYESVLEKNILEQESRERLSEIKTTNEQYRQKYKGFFERFKNQNFNAEEYADIDPNFKYKQYKKYLEKRAKDKNENLIKIKNSPHVLVEYLKETNSFDRDTFDFFMNNSSFSEKDFVDFLGKTIKDKKTSKSEAYFMRDLLNRLLNHESFDDIILGFEKENKIINTIQEVHNSVKSNSTMETNENFLLRQLEEGKPKTKSYDASDSKEIILKLNDTLNGLLSPSITSSQQVMNETIKLNKGTYQNIMLRDKGSKIAIGQLGTDNSLNYSQSILNFIKNYEKYNSSNNAEMLFFDLETIGGTDPKTGKNTTDIVTEMAITTQEKGKPAETITAAFGVSKDELEHYGYKNRNIIEEIKKDIKNNQLTPGTDTYVAASRLTKYSTAQIEEVNVEGLGKIKAVTDFIGDPEITIDNVEKGLEKLNSIDNYYEKNRLKDGRRMDHVFFEKEYMRLYNALESDNKFVAGYNQIDFDIPVLNRFKNKLGKKDAVIKNLPIFDRTTSSNILDMQGIMRFAIRNIDVENEQVFPGMKKNLIDKNNEIHGRYARQEFMAEARNVLKSGAAHVASQDTDVGTKLINDIDPIINYLKDEKLINEKYINMDELSNQVFRINDAKIDENNMWFYKNSEGDIEYANGLRVNSLGGIDDAGKFTSSGINKRSLYQIDGFGKLNITDENLLKELSSVLPKEASGQYYSVSLKELGENGGNIVRIFQTEERAKAFIAENAKQVGFINEDGTYSIVDDKNVKNLFKINDIDPFKADKDGNRIYSDDEILKGYIKRSSEIRSGEKTRRSFMGKYNSFDRVRKAYELMLLEKQNPGVKLPHDYLSYGINEENMSEVSKKIRNAYVNISGIESNPVNQGTPRVVSSAVKNIDNMVSVISENEDLYGSIITNISNLTEEVINGKRHYKGLYDQQSASYIFEHVYNEIIQEYGNENSRPIYSKSDFARTYDVDVSRIKRGKSRNILNRNNNILTFTFNGDKTFKVGDKILDFMLEGSSETKETINASTKKALLLEFIDKTSLNTVLNINESNKEYSFEGLSTILSEAMMKRKRHDPYSNILIDRTNPARINALLKENVLDPNKIKDLDLNSIVANKVKKYSNTYGADTSKRMDLIVDHILNSFVPTDADVEAMVSKYFGGLESKAAQDDLALEKDLLNRARTDIRGIINDIVGTMSEIGGSVSIEDGRIKGVLNNQMIDIAVPQIKIADQGFLYTKLNNENIKLNHKLGFNNNGFIEIESNINDVYKIKNGKQRQKVRKIIAEKKKEGKKFSLDDVANMFSMQLKDLSEESKMQNITPRDAFTSRMLDTEEGMNILFYSLFTKDSSSDIYRKYPEEADKILKIRNNYSDLLDEGLYFNEDVIQKIKEYYGKSMKPDSNNPELKVFTANEGLIMLREALISTSKYASDASTSNGNRDAARLISRLISTQASEKQSIKGMVSLSTYGQMISPLADYDNPGRPVYGSSGNAAYIRTAEYSDEVLEKLETPDYIRGRMFTNPIVESTQNINIAGQQFGMATRIGTANLTTEQLIEMVNGYYNDVFNENTVDKNISNVSRKTADYIMAKLEGELSTFEQQQIMNPILFEKTYGERAAVRKYISQNLNLEGYLNNKLKEIIGYNGTSGLDEEDIEMIERLKDSRFNVDSQGNVTFGKNFLVDSHDKVFESLDYMGEEQAIGGKLRRGIFGMGVTDINGIDLDEEQLTTILKEHVDELSSVKNREERFNIAKEILEKENYKVRYFIEDVNKISLPKINQESSEKSMTYLPYAKTGSLDDNVKGVFTEIDKVLESNGIRGVSNNTILTKASMNAYLDEYSRIMNIDEEKALLNRFGFDSRSSLYSAVHNEQFSIAKFLSGIKDLSDVGIISNNKPGGHKNEGMLAQSFLADFNMTLAKYLNDGKNITEKSLVEASKFMVDLMENDDNYAIFNTKTFNSDMTSTVSKVKGFTVNSNGSINIPRVNSSHTKSDEIHFDAIVNIAKRIQEEMINRSKDLGINFDENDIIYREAGSYYYRDKIDGELILGDKASVGRAITRNENGKKVLLGRKSVEATSLPEDPETQTFTDSTLIEDFKKKTKAMNRQILIKTQIQDSEKELAIQREKQEAFDRLIEKNVFISEEQQEEIDRVEDNIKRIENRLSVQKQAFADAKEIRDIYDEKISRQEPKFMKYSPAEERILKSRRFDQSTENAINYEIAKNSAIENVITNSELKNFMDKTEGRWKFKEDTINTSPVQELINRNIKRKYYDPTREAELTEEALKLDEYKHLTGTYNYVKENKLADQLGVDSTEKLYQAMSFYKASQFNGALAKDETTRADMIDKYNFKEINILDLPTSGFNYADEDIAKNNYLIDLGDKIGERLEDNNSRVIAVPFGGKYNKSGYLAKDETRKKLASLQKAVSDYNEYTGDDTSEIAGVTKKEAFDKVIRLKDELSRTIMETLSEKEGLSYDLVRTTSANPGARVKITGISNYKKDPEILKRIQGENSALDRAIIDGKSVREWEELGVHHNYAFLTSSQLEDAGLFDKDHMEALGFTKKSQMEEYLKKHGTTFTGERYPAIYHTSAMPLKVFLNDDMAENAAMLPVHVMLALNGDVDGDSISMQLLKGSKMDDTIYQSLKNMDDVDRINYMKDHNYSQEEYKLFEKVNALIRADSIVRNPEFYRRAQSTLDKDVKKNVVDSMIEPNKIAQAHRQDLMSLEQERIFKENYNALVSDAYQKFEKSGGDLKKLKVNGKTLDDDNAFVKYIKQARSIKMENPDRSIRIEQTESAKSIINLIETTSQYLLETFDRGEKSSYYTEKTFEELLSKGGIYETTRAAAKGFTEQAIARKALVAKPAIGEIDSMTTDLDIALENLKSMKSTSVEDSFSYSLAQEGLLKPIKQTIISLKHSEDPTNLDKLATYKRTLSEDLYKNKDKNAMVRWLIGDELTSGNVETDDLINAYKNNLRSLWGEENTNSRKLFNRLESEVASIEQIEKGDIDAKARAARYVANDIATTLLNANQSDNVLATLAMQKMGKGGSKDPYVMNKSNGGSTSMASDLAEYYTGKHLAEAAEQGRYIREVEISESQAKQTMEFASKMMYGSTLEEAINTAASSLRSAHGSGLAMGVIGLTSGLMAAGFAGGNPLRQDNAMEESTNHQQMKTIPDFFDDVGGYAGPSNNGGYIINMKADTKLGRKNIERNMEQIIKQTSGRGVNINMSIRTKNGSYSKKDIEDWISNNI